jgi:hypothetical protein
MDGGSAGLILSDVFEGGEAETSFTNCDMDGGAVIHGQTCGCCAATDGGAIDTTLNAVYSGGNANYINTGSNIDGGNA